MKNFKSNSKRTVRVLPLVLVLLSVCSVALAAPGWSSMSARQSDQTELSDVQVSSAWQPTYQGYRSQIFEVGTTNVPSDYSEVSSGSSDEQGGHKGHMRKLGGGTDVGEQSNEYPIGEPWILLLFALLACGVIAYHRMNIKHNKNMKNKILNQLFSSCKKWKTLVLISTLLTLGVGQMWGAKGFFTDGQWNVKYYDGSGSDKWIGEGRDGSTKDLGIKTTLYLKGSWVKTWSDGGWTQSSVVWNYGLSSSYGNTKTATKSSVQGNQTWDFSVDYNVIANAPNNPGQNTIYMYWRLDDYVSSTASYINFTIPGFKKTSVSQDFGNVTVRSTKDLTISFTQHYGTALTTSNCALSGTNSSEFEVRSISETGVTVRFKPSSNGSKSATLTITDAHSKTCTITLSGKTQRAVTYKKGDNGTGSDITDYKVYNTNLTLRSSGFTRTGYNLTAWNTSSNGTSGTSYALGATYSSNNALTLYPTWTAKTTTITLNNADATTAGTTEVTATYDATIPTITIPTKTGYTFGGYWGAPGGTGPKYINADGTGNGTWQNEASTYTLYAAWAENKSTISLVASPSGKGTFQIGGETVTSTTAGVATTREVTAVPIAGYSFDGWSITGGASISSTTDNPTTITGGGAGTAATLTATFVEDLTYYDVTFGVGTSYTSLGSISAMNNTTSSAISSGDDVLSASNITFTASPNTGYVVEGWYTNAACTEGKHDAGSTTYTIASLSSAVTVYVKFVEKTWSVAFAAGTGGTVTTPASTPKTVGQVTGISIAATPATGYTFNTWSSSSGGSFTSGASTNSNTFKPTANTTVTASFTEKMTTVTVNVSPTGTGTLTVGGAAFTPGNTTTAGVSTSRTVVATAANDYAFSSWSVTDNATGTSSTNTYTLKGNGSAGTGTLTANFTQVPCTLWYHTSSATFATKTGQIIMSYDADEHAYYADVTSTPSSPYYFRFYHNGATQYSAAWDGSYPNVKSAVPNGSKITCDQNVNSWGNKSSIKYVGETSTTIRIWFDYQNKQTWITADKDKQYVLRGAFADNAEVLDGMPGWDATTSYFDGLASGNTGTYTATLNATEWYHLKAYDMYNSTWYGPSSDTGLSDGVLSAMTAGGGGDFYFQTTIAGLYTFTFDKSSGTKLKVDYPTAYTVTFSANTISGSNGQSADPTASYNSGATSVTSGDYVPNGTSVTFTAAAAKSGYTFNGWYDATTGGTKKSVGTNLSYSETISGSAITRYARYTQNTHSVTLTNANTSQGTVNTSSPVTVGEAEAVQIQATPKTNYMFKGWVQTAGAGTVTYHVGAGADQIVDDGGNGKATTYITVTGGDVTLQATWDDDRWSGYYVHYGNDGKNADGGADASQTRAWADGNLYKKAGEMSGTVSYFTYTASAADVGKVIEFKIVKYSPDTWYGYNASGGGKITGSITDAVLNTSYGNGRMVMPTPGEYVFKWDSNGNKLSITYPAGNYLRGDFNSWGWSDLLTPTGNENEYACTVTLSAGQEWNNPDHGFKMVLSGVHYGKNSTKITRAENTANGLGSSGANIGLKTDVAGSYTFTINSSTKNLTVTYPAAYRISYDANGADGGTAPATSDYYAEGADAILAGNVGNLCKNGYAFKGWNTLATGEGASYAPKGTYTNIQSDVTLYAQWEENDKIMYYYNNNSWGTVKAHIWHYGTPEWSTKGAYPGVAMTNHQGQVYKTQYCSSIENKVVFNNGGTGDGNKTADLTIADGQTGNKWFYNPNDATVNAGGIHHGWSQYFMIADYPTTKQVAVVGEKITIDPVFSWAEGVDFDDINITANRDSGSTNVTAMVAGTKIIATATAAGTAKYTITYSYLTTTITKVIRFQFAAGITVQSKVPKTDPYWQYYQNIEGIHYWGTNLTPGDVKMTWLKADENYDYYQALVPLGTDNKTNFLFYFDSYSTDAWRKTLDVTGVTSDCCYTITLQDGNKDIIRKAELSGTGLCSDSYQVVITMGSGDIYTSNIVTTTTDTVSFFAPSANESKSYRRGTVTLEHNGLTVHTYPANTFSASGVYTATINANYSFSNLALYTGDYYIRTDGAAGGWDNYKTNPANKMTEFTRNTNFPNESFSYYWVANVGHGLTQNIKGTVANDYNPVLCSFSPDETANEPDGINLRFGYEPTTNDLVRGIIGGSTTNNFLNIVCADGSLIYKEMACTTLLDESHYESTPQDSKFQDKSNWVYEVIVYAKIDATHPVANVVLNSYYYGIHYLLGMVKDDQGRETSTPVSFPVIKTGTTEGIYGLRVVYDFKTNRLFAAWAPADRVIDGVLDVDADVMFLRHEDGDAAQISFNTNESRIEEIKQAIFALELDNEESTKIKGKNIERHYFISLPFDCNVKDIFGIGGFMNYWGIQRYNGAKRAQIGWFQDTPTFWEWLGLNDVMNAGEGYLLSVDKDALERDDVWKEGVIYQTRDTVLDPVTHKPIKTADGLSDSVVWVTHTDGSMLTMYFPSTTSGFTITPATGEALTITYPDQPCSITRDDRDKKDSNWKCIGTPGYKNITVTSYSALSPDLVWNEHTAPNFLYEFHEQTSGATWAKGTYTVTDGSEFTYHSFHSYMVQFAGTIDWAQYSKGDVAPSPIAPKRMPTADTKTTKVEIELLSSDDDALDRTFVWLQENATTGFDQNFDLNKMIEKKANQIYSLAENEVPFAANVLPLGTDTVPLVVNIANEGEYTFSLNVDKHVGMAPILYDMYKSEQINLLTTNYAVELEKGKHEDRFFLLFQPEVPIVTNFETSADGGQNVHSSEAIYDVLGRRVNTIYPGHLYIVNGEKRIAK